MSHLPGRVLRSTGGFIDVATDEGTIRCRLRGRLKREKSFTDLCVAGDEVMVRRDTPNSGVVEEVLPRRTRISRVHPGRGGALREDVLAANLDQVMICVAYGEPVLRPRLIDRFLVIAEHNHVTPILVANKADRPEAEEQRELVLPYRDIGYQLLETSAHTGQGMDDLRALIGGRITAVCGPSGAGKSSLVNALEPSLSVRVGEVSDAHGKGRHTTRVATLYPLTAGGYLVDTPGIRELAAYGIPSDALDACFPEFRPYLRQCTYRSCRHVGDPGCAIEAAVNEEIISEERYDSYLRLLLGEERPERTG